MNSRRLIEGTLQVKDDNLPQTEAHIDEALRLSPRHLFAYHCLLMIGFAKLQLSADAEAVDWLRRSIEANRNYPLTHFVPAAALALIGSLDEAKGAAKARLAER
jgi:hypothetical protein